MENQKTSLILALPKTSNKTVSFIPRWHFYICFSYKSPLSLVMFQTIVAEMTTKDKSYGDYFPADSIALFIAFSPNRNILLR